MYVYGDLEVDIPYVFNGCNIRVRSGGKLIVKSGGALTLTNNTVADALIITGDAICQSLWNGIEVLPGGSLTTNDAIVQNAYYAVSPINPGNITPLPMVSLTNTMFKRDFIGINASKGSFIISNFTNNVFEGSSNNPIYPASTCNVPAPIGGIPYSQRTYCGIYFDGSFGGKLLLAGQSVNNVFKDLQAGIVCLNGTAFIQQCRFENIRFLQNTPAFLQGTAVSFVNNAAGKQFTFTGLGKEAIPTINNCERGFFLYTTQQATTASVSECRMEEVSNGVEFEEAPSQGVFGNFSMGTVSNCYIGCTNYLDNIKKRSTGIEVKDPNIAFSNFQINGNDIDMNQPEAFSPNVDPEISPTGINVVAMHNQASSNGMLLNIASNKVNLIAGLHGITTENIVNANISNNEIVKTKESQDSYRCISVVGGLDNVLTCNTTTNVPQGGSVGFPFGIVCESSLNVRISQNTAKDMTTCLGFQFDNATDCVISQNNVENSDPNIIAGTGIFYGDALTGPQYLQGNDWLEDFFFGAFFLHGPDNGFSYCDSRYQVSTGANVNNPTNPVVVDQNDICNSSSNNWFTIVGAEIRYTCGVSTGGGGTLAKNEADLHLADGGTLNLSPGYKWSSEINLIRKFTENPGLAAGDAVINGFLQAQQGQPANAMYGLRNGINGLEGSISPSLQSNIQNTLAQLETNEANMLALIASINSDPNALPSFTSLNAQTEALELSLQSYLASALTNMATSAVAVRNTNNGINDTALPPAAERYINGLYLETQFIAPRPLTTSELEATRQIGLHCPNEAGSIVYLARAMYYLQTGATIHTDCGSFAPPIGVGERDNITPSKPESELKLTPNPADDAVAIKLPVATEGSTVTLSDLWGKVLFQQKISDSVGPASLSISTEKLASGIYLVTVKGKSGKRFVKRLAITH